MNPLLLIILILLIFGSVGSFPAWEYSRGWGYGPVGGIGFILVIVIVFGLLSRR